MAKILKDLIDGQKITIDNHKPNVPFDWDNQDIHLHKKMNRGNDKTEMLIHLNGHSKEISFRREGKCNSNKLTEEVREVLSDNKEKVRELCEYIVKQLWTCKHSSAQKLLEVADHIATQFGLDPDASKVIKQSMDFVVKEYTEGVNRYRAKVSSKSVEIGQV